MEKRVGGWKEETLVRTSELAKGYGSLAGELPRKSHVMAQLDCQHCDNSAAKMECGGRRTVRPMQARKKLSNGLSSPQRAFQASRR